MNKIYFFQAFMSFAKAMVGLFLPIYLYSLGFSLKYIFVYAIGVSIVYLLCIPIVVSIISKIGFKNIFLLTVPIYFLHLISLNYVLDSILYFHLAWISIGVYLSLFWPAFHSEVAVNGTRKHRSSEVGTLQVIVTIIRGFAPLVAGFILQISGYWTLLLVAMALTTLGTIPLLMSEDIKLKNYKFKYKDYLRLIKLKGFNESKIAFASQGIHANALGFFAWPIILFILLENSFVNWGLLVTFVSMIGIFFILYFRKYLDKKDKNKVLKVTSRLLSINWFLRSLVLFFGSIFLYVVESATKVVISVYELTFSSIFYNNAKKLEYMDYIILMEFFLNMGKVLFCLLAILLLFIFGESIQTLIYIIAFGLITPNFVRNLKEV